MIIPSYTEDDILRELLDDYKSVERKAKKVAFKEIEKMKKLGSVKEPKFISEYYRTKNGNKWHILIVCNLLKKNPWAHRKHCVVELENGRKDVYYLRGLRFGPPYYVKIYSHALRRMRERFCPKDGKELETNPDVMVDKVAFHPSEQGFYQRLTRPDLADFIEECEDRSEVAGIAVTRAAVFVGYRSDKGNYVFKTFLGAHEAWNSKKRGLFEFLQLCYSNLNDHLLRDIGPSIKHIPFDKQLAAMCHTYPEMKPYAENAGVGLHVLYL
ncbi:MAG: hypothetical protein IJV19_00180 [Prevotella sp.]|nr:hypothetical protein [Prevotella sp.]